MDATDREFVTVTLDSLIKHHVIPEVRELVRKEIGMHAGRISEFTDLATGIRQLLRTQKIRQLHLNFGMTQEVKKDTEIIVYREYLLLKFPGANSENLIPLSAILHIVGVPLDWEGWEE